MPSSFKGAVGDGPWASMVQCKEGPPSDHSPVRHTITESQAAGRIDMGELTLAHPVVPKYRSRYSVLENGISPPANSDITRPSDNFRAKNDDGKGLWHLQTAFERGRCESVSKRDMRSQLGSVSKKAQLYSRRSCNQVYADFERIFFG
jgi:hypothetical protein